MGQKISELPVASSLNGDEIVPVVQSGETRRTSVDLLRGDITRVLARDVTFVNNSATLDASELASTLRLIGTLTAPGTFTFPETAKGTFTVFNHTQGGRAVTVAYATGEGVTLAAGTQAVVVADGTKVGLLLLGTPNTWTQSQTFLQKLKLFDSSSTVSTLFEIENQYGQSFAITSNGNPNSREVFLKIAGVDFVRAEQNLWQFATRSVQFNQPVLLQDKGVIRVSGVQGAGALFLNSRNYDGNVNNGPIVVGDITTSLPSGVANSANHVIELARPVVQRAGFSLQSSGGLSLGANTTFTSPVTLGASHYALYANTSAGSITQNLPDATGLDGREYVFYKASDDTNLLNIVPLTGQGDIVTLRQKNESVELRAFNGVWRRKGEDARLGNTLVLNTTGGTYNLTSGQASKGVVAVQGTLTSALIITIPDGTSGVWEISNRTSGAFSVTFKTVSGTGLNCPQGFSKWLRSDGVNVLDDAVSVAQLSVSQSAAVASLSINGQNTYPVYGRRSVVEWFIDFDQGIQGTPLNSSLSGTGAILSANASAATQGRPGIVQFGTGTTDTGRVAVLSSDNGYSLGGNSSVWESELALPGGLSTNTEQYLLRAGWFNAYTSNTSSQTGVAFFEYDQRISPNWLLGIGTARVDSGVAVVAGSSPVTFIRLKIETETNNTVRFYINSTLVNTQNSVSGLTVPTASCIALNKVVGTNSANLRVDYAYWKIALSNPRA